VDETDNPSGRGNSAWEQALIKSYLAQWEDVIESPSFGGDVTTFLKTTTDPIEILKSQHLKNLINGGVKIMSFFGHGSANGFDISTDELIHTATKGDTRLWLPIRAIQATCSIKPSPRVKSLC
jgi:hypothetical protein